MRDKTQTKWLYRVTIGIVLAAVVALTSASGCVDDYNDERGTGDAPVAESPNRDAEAEIINMPNGFPNLATKCDGHGHRVYVATHTEQRQQIAVIDDEGCA